MSVTPQKRFTHYKCQKNTYTIIIKTVSCCYILRMLIQDYANNFHANNMANQSKLQLFLLEMEQHNLLLIAIAYN